MARVFNDVPVRVRIMQRSLVVTSRAWRNGVRLCGDTTLRGIAESTVRQLRVWERLYGNPFKRSFCFPTVDLS